MANTKLVICHPGGSGGRFIESIFNYLIHNSNLDVLDTSTGSAHNVPNIGQNGVTHIPCGPEYATNYYNEFKEELAELGVAPISKFSWNNVLLTIFHTNEFPFTEKHLSVFTKFIQSINLSQVITSHILQTLLLEKAFIANNQTPLFLLIQLQTIEDFAATRALVLSKNNHISYDKFSCTEEQVLGLIYSIFTAFPEVIQLKQNIIAKVINENTAKNQVILPFSKIRLQDTEYIISFVKDIATRISVPISTDQENNIRQYVNKYFSLQPILTGGYIEQHI